jgi:hypothetical protein
MSSYLSPFKSKKYKNEISTEIEEKINDENLKIKNIIDLRKSLKNAKSKSIIKSFYASKSARESNTRLQEGSDKSLSEKINKINERILKKIKNTDKENLKNIEHDIYEIYKNNNTKIKKIKEIIKNKDIDRDVLKKHNPSSSEGYLHQGKKYIGNTGRHLIDKASDLGKYTGLSSVTKSLGINKYMPDIPDGSREKVKKFKLNIQTLLKKKDKLKEQNEGSINKQNELNEINEQIKIKKRRIKEITGINYNETSETYENIITKNNFNFDLDGEYNKLLYKKKIINNINIYKNLLTTINKTN